MKVNFDIRLFEMGRVFRFSGAFLNRTDNIVSVILTIIQESLRIESSKLSFLENIIKSEN